MTPMRIAAAGLAGLMVLGGLVCLVWGLAVWFSLHMAPVAVPFAVAGVLIGGALLIVLVLKAMQPRVVAHSPAAAGGLEAVLMQAAPAELAVVSRLCVEKPMTGLGVAFALGLMQTANRR